MNLEGRIETYGIFSLGLKMQVSNEYFRKWLIPEGNLRIKVLVQEPAPPSAVESHHQQQRKPTTKL